MRFQRTIGSLLALLTVALAAGALWIALRREEHPVFLAIRFNAPTNLVQPTNVSLFSELLTEARKTAHEPAFQTSLANVLGTSPDTVKILHVEQYRCTSIMDASFATSEPALTNRLQRSAYTLLVARLTNRFPDVAFELVNEQNGR